MSRPLIGRTIRRLRQDKGLTQQALAQRLGISGSYLNLIEADQRGVTASLLLKLAAILQVELATLSGQSERQLEAGLREVMTDPMLGLEAVPEAELQAMAGSAPNASRAVLALYRAWRVAREDASGLALPSGRRLQLPAEEARDFFQDRANHFPALETVAEQIGAEMAATPAELNHAIAQRLRQRHGLVVRVGALEGSLRRFDPAARLLELSESLPRGSRGFQMAFQLMLLEARGVVEEVLAPAAPSSAEAAALIRIGLLNYGAAALLMPYAPFLAAARELRHDLDRLCARFGQGFEQVTHRLCTMQRDGERGVPFFFLRTDTAGNVDKRFSAAGFPFARFGGSCPRWLPHITFASPERLQVQIAELPDGASFLCFARMIAGPVTRWGEPVPTHVVTLGCDISHAGEVVYADGMDLGTCRVGIGLSCRLCERADCRSRAFPPLEHRLSLDPHEERMAPWAFSGRRKDELQP
ncbi:helix-turn-helix domain-containing protein [Roseomonas marmotae]|uniref:DUF2083 domain-containing protein n=1 Tax=Roseomonas marmotae TaxID=2768161 RepID=A0ABS3K9C7_9PROT|nr:helix-turn-helix transcriptional regulator [Roseomonas marmotae]MBO1073233.1 DUF2083 domain-containing protein [Roseomonas marmotae]QTI79142.1 DUF2083 domain-containing protein [Roseomonas marmotae]